MRFLSITAIPDVATKTSPAGTVRLNRDDLLKVDNQVWGFNGQAHSGPGTALLLFYAGLPRPIQTMLQTPVKGQFAHKGTIYQREL